MKEKARLTDALCGMIELPLHAVCVVYICSSESVRNLFQTRGSIVNADKVVCDLAMTITAFAYHTESNIIIFKADL